MDFIVAKKKGPHGLLIVITDSDILGEYFEEGRLQLDLKKDFYKGDYVDRENLIKLIGKAQHLHLTGENSIKLGISLGLIDKNKIINIKNIPHAEVVIR